MKANVPALDEMNQRKQLAFVAEMGRNVGLGLISDATARRLIFENKFKLLVKQEEKVCGVCAGTGDNLQENPDLPCPECHGSGKHTDL